MGIGTGTKIIIPERKEKMGKDNKIEIMIHCEICGESVKAVLGDGTSRAVFMSVYPCKRCIAKTFRRGLDVEASRWGSDRDEMFRTPFDNYLDECLDEFGED
jgi:hypothetical protein